VVDFAFVAGQGEPGFPVIVPSVADEHGRADDLGLGTSPDDRPPSDQ